MTTPDPMPPGGPGTPGAPGSPGSPGGGPGSLRPTPPRLLVVVALVGLVGGWLVRPVTERLGATGPIVTWGQPTGLALIALIAGATAWLTHRAVQVERRRLAAHQAVNRLLMARACALVGAVLAGAYAGYAVSWLGLDAQLAEQRSLRAGLAALAGLATCVAGLLLERACRVRPDDPQP